VCVCSCTHTNTHWHFYPTSKIEKTTDSISISPSVKNSPPRQATSALHRLVEPSHPRPPTRMNKLLIHERMCTPCSDCVANMYGDVKNIGMYTPACTSAQDTCLVHTTITAKMHMHPRKHACATLQQLLHHGNHCDLSCNFSSAQDSVRIHVSLWCTAVADALSHGHLLIIRVSAGPNQFVYGSHSKLGHGAYPSQNHISTIVFAGFFKICKINVKDVSEEGRDGCPRDGCGDVYGGACYLNATSRDWIVTARRVQNEQAWVRRQRRGGRRRYGAGLRQLLDMGPERPVLSGDNENEFRSRFEWMRGKCRCGSLNNTISLTESRWKKKLGGK